VKKPITLELLEAHLRGLVTIGMYVLNEDDTCTFTVFDVDYEDGLVRLAMLADELRQQGIPTLLEASRRGGRLWIHVDAPTSAALVRVWLLPFAQAYGMELYPKQETRLGGVGSLIRLPLGVHRRSRGWYPFLTIAADGSLVPVEQTMHAAYLFAFASIDAARGSRKVG
jgi:hypothetical protein